MSSRCGESRSCQLGKAIFQPFIRRGAAIREAEASRFTELSGLLRTEVTQLTARLVQVQEALSHDIRDNGNALAASLGEMDDRLRRSGALQGPSA